MTKQQFILTLGNKLSGLPKKEVEERLNFYIEIIEDRIEDGVSEEEAVSAVGTVDEIAEQIIKDIPITKIAKEKIKPKRRIRVWEIILLILGSPIWLSLLIASIAVILSVYVSLWSVIVSLWAVFTSVAAYGILGIAAGAGFAADGYIPQGIAVIGTSIFSAGFSIFLFFGCKEATKGLIILTKKFILAIKKCLIKKEEE